MTVRQESMIERNHLALVVAAMLAIASLPARAQPSDGIPGVLAPGAVPELVQEGFVFTEGPVGTADGALYLFLRPPPHATLATRRLAKPYLGRTCTG
jgi:hypothetical protein